MVKKKFIVNKIVVKIFFWLCSEWGLLVWVITESNSAWVQTRIVKIVFQWNATIDFSTGMSYLQNQILHTNLIMIVKTVFLCDASIHRDSCFKLQLQSHVPPLMAYAVEVDR